MRLPFTASENDDESAAARAKRKRRRSPGGLGRNLARILTDSQDGAPGPRSRRGLVQLVGGESVTRVTEIEKFVVDAALRAVVDSFALDAMVVAAGPMPGEPNEPSVVCSQLPPSWSADSGVLLNVYGNLWPLLDPEAPPMGAAGYHEVAMESHRLWLHRAVESERPLVAAAVRSTEFATPEAKALVQVVGAMAAALHGGSAGPALRQSIMEGTTVSLKSEGPDVLAEVNAEWAPLTTDGSGSFPGRRTGVGRACEPVLAVARAAAKACRPRCEVAFAGSTELDDGDVAVALVHHHRHGLRLGYAIRPRGDLGGVAEAVFTAAL